MTSPDRPALSAALEGCTIVIAVDRRSSELAAALERHGAQVRRAPALSILPHIDDDALIAATRALVETPPDVVVVTTGVGFRGWMAGLKGYYVPESVAYHKGFATFAPELGEDRCDGLAIRNTLIFAWKNLKGRRLANHLAWLASRDASDPIPRALDAARSAVPQGTLIEIEVDTLDQLDVALGCRPDVVLVDNLGPEALVEAVRRRDAKAPGVLLESSGGITLETVGARARTGVDRISVGALTHSAAALDVALDMTFNQP